MPLMLYPKCWRGRTDCSPIHCIDGVDEEPTNEQMETLDYEPNSFICCGLNDGNTRKLPQDVYRLCFKNDVSDEMSDNDVQDLTHIVSVVGQALAFDATRKVNSGTIEVPTIQVDKD